MRPPRLYYRQRQYAVCAGACIEAHRGRLILREALRLLIARAATGNGDAEPAALPKNSRKRFQMERKEQRLFVASRRREFHPVLAESAVIRQAQRLIDIVPVRLRVRGPDHALRQEAGRAVRRDFLEDRDEIAVRMCGFCKEFDHRNTRDLHGFRQGVRRKDDGFFILFPHVLFHVPVHAHAGAVDHHVIPDLIANGTSRCRQGLSEPSVRRKLPLPEQCPFHREIFLILPLVPRVADRVIPYRRLLGNIVARTFHVPVKIPEMLCNPVYIRVRHAVIPVSVHSAVRPGS